MRTQQRVAGVLSLVAAAVHGGLTGAHFQEWWGYGVFFLVATLCQVVLGLALLVEPFDPAKLPVPERVAKRWLYGVGALGMLVLVAFYLWTRLVGVPGGPGVGETEEVAPVDVVAQLSELGCAALLAWLVFKERGSTTPSGADTPSRSGR